MPPRTSPTPDAPAPNVKAPEQQREAERQRVALVAFIGDFGLDIARDRLSSSDLFIFAAAQKLDHWIDKLKIPTATRTEPTGKKEKVEEEVERVVERTEYTEGERPTPIPSDTMDVSTLQRPEELPEILPNEWVTEEVAPDLFYKRMRERELLRRQWREETREPITTEDVVKEKIIREKEAPPEEIRRHAYVLLDTSGSMNTDDGRGIAARAFALAFLRRGFMQRAQLGIRPFEGGVHDLSRGKTQEDLQGIALRIARLRNDGGTNIHYAIAHAVQDITQHGTFDRADILLLTDGLSDLGSNPLGDVRLHTVILGDPMHELRSDSRSDARRNLRTLEGWSTTFLRIKDTKDLYRELDVTNAEVLEIEKESKAIEQELAKLRDPKQLEDLLQRAASLDALVQFYLQQLKQHARPSTAKLQKVRQFLQKLLGDRTEREQLIQGAQERAAREEAERAMREAEERAARDVELTARSARGRAEAEQDIERIRAELAKMGIGKGGDAGEDGGEGGAEGGAGSGGPGVDAPGPGRPRARPKPRPEQQLPQHMRETLLERLARWWRAQRARPSTRRTDGEASITINDSTDRTQQ